MAAAPEPTAAAQALALVRLGHLQIAVLDYDIPSAQLIRRVLSAIGITQTSLFRDSREALALVKERPVDILIAAYESRPESGVALTRYLRGPQSPNRLQPILMTTTTGASEVYSQARDAGVSEILVKPFNVRAMLERITGIIDQPRAFILTHDYTGPDRRRTIGQPPEGIERRGQGGPDSQPVFIGKDALGDVFIDDRPRIVKPDFSVKQRVEAAASRMAGIENILPQAEAARMEEDFLQWMQIDLATIRQSYRQLLIQPESVRVCTETICKAALSIRSRALRSGYPLAARLAIALHDFCQKKLDVAHPQHLTIIGKHVDSLQAIFTNRLTGDDNVIARELVGELQTLVKRYT